MLTAVKRVARVLLGPMEESDLLYELLRRDEPGVVFEVGAHYGDGALKRFALDGWRVHAFEPDPQNRIKLEEFGAQLPNVQIVPKAVSNQPGTLMLYRSPDSTGISSLAPFTDTHHPALEVEVVTLREYVAENAVDTVTFLKLDVEGYEKFALEGFPWETHSPEAVLLEFEDAKTRPLGYGWSDLADELRSRGYDVLVAEWYPIERYGIEHRFRAFRRYPCGLADPAAWGNLIGVKHSMPRLERRARRAVVRVRARTAVLGVLRRLRR